MAAADLSHSSRAARSSSSFSLMDWILSVGSSYCTTPSMSEVKQCKTCTSPGRIYEPSRSCISHLVYIYAKLFFPQPYGSGNFVCQSAQVKQDVCNDCWYILERCSIQISQHKQSRSGQCV